MENKEMEPFVYDDGIIQSVITDTTLTLTIWGIEIPFTINNKNDGQPYLKSPQGIISLVIQQQLNLIKKEDLMRHLINIQGRILTKTDQCPRGGTDYVKLMLLYLAVSQIFNKVHFIKDEPIKDKDDKKCLIC